MPIFVPMMKEMLDLLMPRTCLVCGRQLGSREEHLCIWCAADLPLTGYWERVHNPMADELNALLERHRAEGERMDYVRAAALLFYHHENPYKRIPRALKYGYDLAAGRFFAARLGKYMADVPHFADVDMVIPVPLHWYRRWRRGYNQAEVIAAEVAGAMHAPLRTDVLYRVRRTRTQTRLDAEDRLRNVAGVFRVRKGVFRTMASASTPAPNPASGPAPGQAVTPRHILLIDDTFTTGATLATCYRALRDVLGPETRISVATLSVVQG